MGGLVSAVNITTGTIFNDEVYNYTANDNLTYINISFNVGQFYLNSIEFCDSTYQENFTTLRVCSSPVGSSGSTTIVKELVKKYENVTIKEQIGGKVNDVFNKFDEISLLGKVLWVSFAVLILLLIIYGILEWYEKNGR